MNSGAVRNISRFVHKLYPYRVQTPESPTNNCQQAAAADAMPDTFDSCMDAATVGNLQFLQLNAHHFDRPGLLREGISLYAAREGHLEVLQWLSLQAALGPETCRGAAAGGQLAVLQWAREQGCHLDADTCAAAARKGHLAVLRWVRHHGCAWRASTCEAAAGGGHLAVLQYAHQNGCAWDLSTCEAAASGGHLAVLQYAHQNGCAWDSRTCESAARGGHLAVLQYARQHNCEMWGAEACSAAAECGHLSILKWLRQHGCQWDSHTTCVAAIYNHLEVLKWARQQDPPCPWWSGGQSVLARHDTRPDVLVFLWQQQAPLSRSSLAQARAAATEMTYAVLLLRAALPDKVPCEIVLSIVNLAYS